MATRQGEIRRYLSGLPASVTVETTTHAHFKVRGPKGTIMVSSSPSGDYALKQIQRDIKRYVL